LATDSFAALPLPLEVVAATGRGGAAVATTDAMAAFLPFLAEGAAAAMDALVFKTGALAWTGAPPRAKGAGSARPPCWSHASSQASATMKTLPANAAAT
jgi:hypothetical protein